MDGATLKADDAGISGPAATGPPNSLAFFSRPPSGGLFAFQDMRYSLAQT